MATTIDAPQQSSTEAIANAACVFVTTNRRDAAALAALPAADNKPIVATEHGSEIEPLLREKTVVLFPANTEQSQQTLRELGERLKGVAKDVLTLDVSGIRPGFGASAWVSDGGDKQKLMQLYRDAKTNRDAASSGARPNRVSRLFRWLASKCESDAAFCQQIERALNEEPK